jgi:hypothetical protein
MEPESGRSVHIDIRMVRTVKTPEERDPVIRHMPVVHPDIEQKKDHDHSHRCRKIDHPHDPQRMRLCPSDHFHSHRGQNNPGQETIHQGGDDMGEGVHETVLSVPVIREQTFKCEDNEQRSDDKDRLKVHRDIKYAS